MREKRRTFALVLDEHGGVAGVVSIRDILEQLVGDLNDEFDEDEERQSFAFVKTAGSSTDRPTSTRWKRRSAFRFPRASTSPSPVSSSIWRV